MAHYAVYCTLSVTCLSEWYAYSSRRHLGDTLASLPYLSPFAIHPVVLLVPLALQ